MNTFFVLGFAVLGFFLFVPGAHAQIPGQSTQYTCPVGSTQVGATQDTGCPLCRHGVTGEVFSVAACSSGAACKQASECVGLDETCPINETFLRWECSTADNTTSHCVKYCSGVPGNLRSDSNETRTGVGDPVAPGARNPEILQWTNRISAALEDGYDGRNNRMVAAILNGAYRALSRTGLSIDQVYWCTYLVIDAYNLAGVKGLGLGQASVAEMVKFWKRTPGYVYLNYSGASNKAEVLRQVRPGDAFFQEEVEEKWTGSEHVSIVTDVKIDANGNGSITTVDSNTRHPTYTFPIDNGVVKNTFFPLRGFGATE